MSQAEQGVFNNRYVVIPRTLIFVFDGSKVLLIKGAKTKRLWANLYNGIGGHVEKGENVLSSARRELREETGLSIDELSLTGVVMIDAGSPTGIELFVFKANYNGGKIIPSSEGDLEWIEVKELGQIKTVEDLTIVLPMVYHHQAGEPLFWGRYWYDAHGNLQTQFIKADQPSE
jgi:8-oxo-dGTP diphosphatase